MCPPGETEGPDDTGPFSAPGVGLYRSSRLVTMQSGVRNGYPLTGQAIMACCQIPEPCNVVSMSFSIFDIQNPHHINPTATSEFGLAWALVDEAKHFIKTN